MAKKVFNGYIAKNTNIMEWDSLNEISHLFCNTQQAAKHAWGSFDCDKDRLWPPRRVTVTVEVEG